MPGNEDKDPINAEAAMGTSCDARQQSRGQSQERQAAPDQAIAEALVGNTAELTVKFTALLNAPL